MDREGWQATVHRFSKSWTRLKQLSLHTSVSEDSLYAVIWTWGHITVADDNSPHPALRPGWLQDSLPMAPPGPGPLLLLVLPVWGVEKGLTHVTLAAMCSSHELHESGP